MRGYHQDFAAQGFVLIGVHAPEFAFEKDLAAVQAAVKQHEIKYPVALDNDMAIWRSYRNNYWPSKFLIDKRGVIRYTHIGEGAYEQTRQMIAALLAE